MSPLKDMRWNCIQPGVATGFMRSGSLWSMTRVPPYFGCCPHPTQGLAKVASNHKASVRSLIHQGFATCMRLPSLRHATSAACFMSIGIGEAHMCPDGAVPEQILCHTPPGWMFMLRSTGEGVHDSERKVCATRAETRYADAIGTLQEMCRVRCVRKTPNAMNAM